MSVAVNQPHRSLDRWRGGAPERQPDHQPGRQREETGAGSLRDAAAQAREVSLQNRRTDRRVRQEARDCLAVIGFSVGASTALALAITVVAALVGATR